MTDHLRRYVCIHGHFYQPPRENPWLYQIEIQPSAHPFHDWNERVADECYTANANARILDNQGRLVDLLNNYRYISFNVGPTLLSWLERHASTTYESILQADAWSCGERSGHGNAIAQAYNHMIMPLANTRDKLTQIVWGIEDFRKRFCREPEGIWLPETAVDKETLEILADQGIRFTILAPSQAARSRTSKTSRWIDLNTSAIDPTRPYLCDLSQGRSIVLFFYHGPISHAIAFERLLDNGDNFKNRLVSAFSDDRPWNQLVHAATDGESFGHHHRFGEMALARMIVDLQKEPDILLTNYGEYLAKHPPSAQAEIVENSSWSCAHGVSRWSEDCGCCLTPRPEWNQKWRTPLRKAMDLLRDRLARIFQDQTLRFLNDPWAARNAYIEVILNDYENTNLFLLRNSKRKLNSEQSTLVLKLLDAQKNAMLMYTSCGWFFDDISGIEALQILRYAARVLQLAAPFDRALQRDFLAALGEAQSNVPPHPNGDEIFRRRISPIIADLPRIAVNAAVSTLFQDPPPTRRLYSCDIEILDPVLQQTHSALICSGRMMVLDIATTDSSHFVYAALLRTDGDLRCYIRAFHGTHQYVRIRTDLFGRIAFAPFNEMIRLMDRKFGRKSYSFTDLFVQQAAETVDLIISQRLDDNLDPFQTYHRKTEDIRSFILASGFGEPDQVLAAANYDIIGSVNSQIEKLYGPCISEHFDTLIEHFDSRNIPPEVASLEKLIRARILFLVRKIEENPQQNAFLMEIASLLNLCRDRNVQPELSEAQAILFRTFQSSAATSYPDLTPIIQELADLLRISIPQTDEIQ
jgi:alpha-amylase/alpha-mannosidase (GH57 family)